MDEADGVDAVVREDLRGKRRPAHKGIRIHRSGTQIHVRIAEGIVSDLGWKVNDIVSFARRGDTLILSWPPRADGETVRLRLPARSRSFLVEISALRVIGERMDFMPFDADYRVEGAGGRPSLVMDLHFEGVEWP